jgi:competence protein ComGC
MNGDTKSCSHWRQRAVSMQIFVELPRAARHHPTVRYREIHEANPMKTSRLAVTSLVLGILSLVLLLVCVGSLFAIPAVICGHMAHSRIKCSAGALSGSGMAVSGLITGYVSIALSVFLIPMMMAIAIPNFVKARDTAQKNVCINQLRQIAAAKEQWALEQKKERGDTPTQVDLKTYLPKGLPTCLKGGTYTIGPVQENPTCTIPDHELP